MFKKTKTTKLLFFLAADIILISLAVWFAFLLRFDGEIPESFLPALEKTFILTLIFIIPIFYFFGLYSFSWSYVSTKELISLIEGVTLAFIFISLAIYISADFPGFAGFPRSTIIIVYTLVVLFAGAIRFSKRIYLNLASKKGNIEKERTLIVGAGDAGEQILRSIQSSFQSPYLPIGFIDDNPFKQGSHIHGIKVLAGINDIPEIVKQHQIERLVIALPSAETSVVKRAVIMARKAGVKKIKVLPPLFEIVNGQVSLPDLRDFQMEDLLERKPVFHNTELIEKFIRQKKVLITGAAGSIGSELSRQAAKFNPDQLLLLDQDETGIFNISRELKDKFPKLNIFALIADILDKNRVEQIFNKFRPNLVFHAAAYKHVPLMEQFPEEAVKNNIFGTRTVAEAALKHNAERFIYISTDKAVNPSSIMGQTKRIGEMICQVLNQKNKTKFISVRFGNVLGSRGSVIPVFKEKIKKRETIEITHQKMKRYFMIIPEAVSLVLQAGQIGWGGEVFVLNMGNPLRIIDLAKQMIRLSGLEPDKDIPIVFSNPRPGEKLFEEIFSAEEGTEATQDRNIFRANLSKVDEHKLNALLAEISEAVRKSDREEIKNILKQIINN